MNASSPKSWIIDPNVDAGTTMRRMRKLVHAALLDAAVIQYANEIIAQAKPRDYPAQIHAVDLFGHQYFRFVGNPIGEQLIRDSLSMIVDIEAKGYVQGACDDAAVLMATLCMANALECQFRAVGFGPRPDSNVELSHVIADAWNGLKWCPLDITKPADMTRAPAVARTLTLEV